MNFDKITKESMKDEYAKEIINWNYDGDYSIYNLPSYEECKKNNYSITNESSKDNYVVYKIDNEVMFYFSIKMIEDKIYIGVGLKPSYCGKGLGKFFLEDSIKEIKRRYPGERLFLKVRTWNKRAIKLYERMGFKIINTMIAKDRFGNDIEFIEMEMNN